MSSWLLIVDDDAPAGSLTPPLIINLTYMATSTVVINLTYGYKYCGHQHQRMTVLSAVILPGYNLVLRLLGSPVKVLPGCCQAGFSTYRWITARVYVHCLGGASLVQRYSS